MVIFFYPFSSPPLNFFKGHYPKFTSYKYKLECHRHTSLKRSDQNKGLSFSGFLNILIIFKIFFIMHSLLKTIFKFCTYHKIIYIRNIYKNISRGIFIINKKIGHKSVCISKSSVFISLYPFKNDS